MADPLHKSSDVPRFDTYPSSPGKVGQSESGATNEAVGALSGDAILDPHRELESQVASERNGRLNRTAGQIGGALGQAVNQARRAPGNARQRLHIVRGWAPQVGGAAEETSTSASSLVDDVRQKGRELTDQTQRKARELGENAQQKARELMDAAQQRGRVLADQASEIGDRVQQRASEMKQDLDVRARELRDEARRRSEQVRVQAERTVRERPLETLGAIAGGAFAVGVILRIVRSRNASRY